MARDIIFDAGDASEPAIRVRGRRGVVTWHVADTDCQLFGVIVRDDADRQLVREVNARVAADPYRAIAHAGHRGLPSSFATGCCGGIRESRD